MDESCSENVLSSLGKDQFLNFIDYLLVMIDVEIIRLYIDFFLQLVSVFLLVVQDGEGDFNQEGSFINKKKKKKKKKKKIERNVFV